MKTIVNILIALLAIFGAYKVYEVYAPPEWPRLESEALENIRLSADSRKAPADSAAVSSAPAKSPAAARSAASRPEVETRRMDCPTCGGEGKLSYADSRGANHVYPCPICNGTGGRDVRLGAGQYVCPDCKGMGVTERREARNGFGGKNDPRRNAADDSGDRTEGGPYYVRSSRCLRCNTSGVITSAKPPQATYGVQTPEAAR